MVPMAAHVSARATTAPPCNRSAPCEAARLQGIRMRTKSRRTTSGLSLSRLASRPELIGAETCFLRTAGRCPNPGIGAMQRRCAAEGGLNEAWDERIDADPVRAELLSPRPRHHDESGFREAVEQASGLGMEARDRGDVDDGTPAWRSIMRGTMR